MKVKAAVKKICPFMTRHEILDGKAELVVTFCQGPLCMSWETTLTVGKGAEIQTEECEGHCVQLGEQDG